jgi:hypothetical protein
MAERYEGKEELLLGIVKDNTAAIVQNTATAATVLAATKELRVEVTELRKANGRGR